MLLLSNKRNKWLYNKITEMTNYVSGIDFEMKPTILYATQPTYITFPLTTDLKYRLQLSVTIGNG